MSTALTGERTSPLASIGAHVVLPKRRIVERTIACLNRCRRLAKDWENLNRKGLAFLRLASIRLQNRRAH
jgi:transposase